MQKEKANITDMYTDLLNLGEIFNVEDRAKKLIGGYKSELKDLTKP